ncbi:MAG: class I SAM-dependent methyltransferase [Candidatus Acidiferrales bacterium]
MTEKTLPDANYLESARRDWDVRAREDARAYINWPDVPNEEEAFFASGRVDYERYVTPFLKKMNFDPSDKAALEIGCGIGRIARWMSQDFGSYTGVDVSPLMAAKAAAYHLPRTQFLAVSGGDLQGVADASVDFVFSFAVFQHVPSKEAIYGYFRETARVLRPGGIFRLHMKGVWTLPLGPLMVEAGFRDRGREDPSEKHGAPFVRLRKLDTWQGRAIEPDEAARELEVAGLKVENTDGAWTPMMWVGGRKPQ